MGARHRNPLGGRQKRRLGGGKRRGPAAVAGGGSSTVHSSYSMDYGDYSEFTSDISGRKKSKKKKDDEEEEEQKKLKDLDSKGRPASENGDDKTEFGTA